MKAMLKSNVISAICFLSVLFYSLPSRGQTFNFRANERNSLHKAAYIKTHGLNDTIIVSHDAWDDMVSNSTTWTANLKFKSVHDFVRFFVDYSDTIKVMEPYTLRLTYKVYGFSNPAAPTTASTSFPPDTLTISYKPDSLAVFQDKQYRKFSGYHKIMIVLTGLYSIDNATGTPTPITLGPSSSFSWLNFNVEGAVLAQPYNKKVKYTSTYKEAYGITGKLQIKPLSASNDNLPVYWQMFGTTLNAANVLPLSPVNYELEWTYVDNYKVDPTDGTSSAISTSNLKYDFSNNATRVILDTNYYKIPLIYQSGYIVYRVRMIRPDSVHFQYPIYGPWTITSTTGTVSTLSADYVHQVGAHINDSLNWQYTVSFAEQGKYKHVMSYYDGMLKNRQSITRFNTMPDKLIATEQIYDFEGRPSISILPTPITDSSFRYQRGLALNSVTDTPFMARDFDTVQLTSCPNDILLPPLSSASLANIYYSPDNPDQAGFQKFVPDAGGYPLVQTIYSPGYDERVEKQGGAGDTLQIGYKHNVKNDYTGTEQTDLNRLFGTNIGWTGYYRKTVSRDPNGQLSINITDYKGKTMMSSMVGLPDTAIHALVSNENLSDTVQYREDFLAGMPEQVVGNQRILDKLFFNEAPGNNTSQYIYHFAPYQTFCPTKYLTVRAAYDYTIIDECGTLVAQSDSILGETGVLSSATADTFYETPPTGFYMEKGKHSLSKVLTINTDDVALAVDSFMSLPANETCLKDEPWFIKESVLSKQFPCPEKYIDLNCPSCGSKKYEMMKELYPNLDSTNVERKYGIYENINGVVVGNGNSDFTIFCGSGNDPGHWTHPYSADTINYILDHQGNEGFPPSGSVSINNWTDPPLDGSGNPLPDGPFIVLSADTLHCKYRYQDTCAVTMPDTVIKYGNIYTHLQQIPVQDFINIFNDTIAEALLPMHPEYCNMLDCVDDDVFPRLLGKIPNAKIAGPLSLLMLNDLIHADPIYAVMSAHPTDFPDPEASLSYLPGGFLCLDTIAFNEAYCKSTDANMLADCQTQIYQDKIANGELMNDYVKERYFESIKRVYLSNRKRFRYVLNPSYSGSVDCSTCEPVRMTLIPDPIFPNNDSIGFSLLDSFVNSLSNNNPNTPSGTDTASGAAATTALQDYFENVAGVNLDTVITSDTLGLGPIDNGPLDNIADSAINGYMASADSILQGTLDHIIDGFVNCTPSGNLDSVRGYLHYLYNTGQVTNFTFTPQQILDALNAASINLDDLCNPYIISYDGLAIQPSEENSGLECGNTVYFNDMGSFLTSTSLIALQNPGTTYTSISLSGTNQFAQSLATELGASSCTIVAAHNSTQHLYTITYSAGLESVKITVKEPISSGVNPFTATGGETITLVAGCYKEVFDIFPSGYIGNLSFALLAKHTPSSGPVTTYRMKAWNDRIGLNDLRDNPISQCVPYTQFRALYQQLQDTMNVYQVKGFSHPYYSTMLRNFMNYNLKKVFTEGQYLDFLENSALADSMLIKDFVVWHAVFADSAAAFTFINDLNAYIPSFNITPSYIYKYGQVAVGINLLGAPKSKLRLYYDFLSSYCSPGYRNITYQDLVGDTYMATVFLPVGGSFSNFPVNFLPIYAGNYDVWNGSAFVPSWGYNIYTQIGGYAANGQFMDILERYNIANATLFLKGIKHAINSEYYFPEKQGYLHYTYGFQSLPPGSVLDTLQTENLGALIDTLNGKTLSYGHPARRDNIQNLYIGDPSMATDGTKYGKLQYIVETLSDHFNNLYGNSDNKILFAGANTRAISMPSGQMLTAYRCRDTAFWYRYFDQGDTLYNVFLRIPAYIDTAYYSSYKLQDYGYNLGEGDSRSFFMKFHSDTAPISELVINGFTDFTVAKNKVLHNVLLTHPVNEPNPAIDTIYNCEHSTLNAAIYEGKIRYKFYIDSIREKLYGDFFAYIMNGGITEKLLVSYRNQRFNYTLYNYDRAGNLAATIPPAGVNPFDFTDGSASAIIDTKRSNPVQEDTIPAHRKPSVYKYNTLNQVIYQNTPDGGETRFFYDAAGRVIFSQNDKQKPFGNMTYTLYDNQGRIVETGQASIACLYFAPICNATPTTAAPYDCYHYDAIKHQVTPYPEIVTDLLHKTNEQVTAYIHSLNREEVVLTTYDEQYLNLTDNPGFTNQENLRKRVAAIRYFDALGTSDTATDYYNYAMHFSYDIAGNVKTLVRDYPQYKSINQEFKRVDYDYDLISGKVNMLSYNRGFPDQYYQKYAYDADNRITKVETSSDGIIWQKDADYQYYQHGPLARMQIGDLNIQGVDYAYTIQGWLKSINSDLLTPGKEMGGDGLAGSPNEIYAPDAAALSLDYFKGDYKPIGTDTVTYLSSLGKSLYNGNIPRATTSIIPFPDLKSQYTYDQLNRIVRADYAYMNRASAALTNTADYYSSYAYDPDGNLKKLVRNGNKAGNLQMDSLLYYYQNGLYSNSSVNDNRLVNITDLAANGSGGNDYPNDINQYTNQYSTRYDYDATGNVIQDQVSGQGEIRWNHYNKVAYDYNADQAHTLTFAYDGTGSRYLKSTTQIDTGHNDSTQITSDYYVRDAQGNILAIYKDESKYAMAQQEWIEYFTYQFMQIPCDPFTYLNKYILPFYGYLPSFTNQVYAYAQTNNAEWVQGQVNDSAVSFYMNNSYNVLNNTISAMSVSTSAYPDMAAWAVDNHTTGILTPALYASAGFASDNVNLMKPFLYHAFGSTRNVTDTLPKGVVGLLCNYAPVIMDSVTADYGLIPKPDDCDQKSDDLIQQASHMGLGGIDFFNEVYAMQSKSITQYKSFLSKLFDGGSIRFYDAGTHYNFSFIEGLCNYSNRGMEDIMKDLSLSWSGDCPTDVATLEHWLHTDPANNAALNDEIQVNISNCGDVLEAVYSSGTTVSNEGILPKIYKYFVTSSNHWFLDTMYSNLGITYDPEDDATSAAALQSAFANDPFLLVDYVARNMHTDTQTIEIDTTDVPVYTIYNFLDSLVRDSVIMGDPYFVTFNSYNGGNFSYLLHDLLLEVAEGNGPMGLAAKSKSDLNAFIDGWNQGRTMLERGNNIDALLRSVYAAAPDRFLNSYFNAAGSTDILTQSLMAIPDLNINRFVDNIYRVKDPCKIYTVTDSIIHTGYINALQERRFSLGTHVLYGSSRLGTKDYLSGQFYKYYKAEGNIKDTATLGGWRPWYNLEVNDWIAGLTLEPYDGMDASSYYSTHLIGQKQYELTNHLGNVQATLTDLPYWAANDTGLVLRKSVAIAAAYDYYPFGMLMPDRYVSDTSSRCITITQTKWVTTWVDSCYDVFNWVWPEVNIASTDLTFSTKKAGNIQFNGPNFSSHVYFGINTLPNVEQTITFSVLDAITPANVQVGETINGNWTVLGSTTLDHAGDIEVNVVPSGNHVEVRLLGPYRVVVSTVCISKPVQTQQTFLVDVCNNLKDRYRFGFNGQEKVNEWAGVGNHLDFEERGYDARTARFPTIDQMKFSFPGYSPYIFALNRPIDGVDAEGMRWVQTNPNNIGVIVFSDIQVYGDEKGKGQNSLVVNEFNASIHAGMNVIVAQNWQELYSDLLFLNKKFQNLYFGGHGGASGEYLTFFGYGYNSSFLLKNAEPIKGISNFTQNVVLLGCFEGTSNMQTNSSDPSTSIMNKDEARKMFVTLINKPVYSNIGFGNITADSRLYSGNHFQFFYGTSGHDKWIDDINDEHHGWRVDLPNGDHTEFTSLALAPNGYFNILDFKKIGGEFKNALQKGANAIKDLLNTKQPSGGSKKDGGADLHGGRFKLE
jgi:hypothetical protein